MLDDLNERPERTTAAAMLLVVVIFVAVLLFGATRIPVGSLRYDVRHLTAGVVILLASVSILFSKRDDLPAKSTVALCMAFPTWLLIQLIPLPRVLVGLLSPKTVEWIDRFWPGPLFGEAGRQLLGEVPPEWIPLTLDPVGTREAFFRVVAMALVFLVGYSVFRPGTRERHLLVLSVAVFAGAEAAYGLGQWITGSAKALWFDRVAYLDCATGTLINRNHFAILLYLGLGCTLSLLVSRVGRRLEARHERETAVWVSLAVLAGMQVAGLLASKSRAGVAAGCLVLLPTLPELLRGSRVARVVAGVVVALAAIPVLFVAGPEIVERVAQLPSEWNSPSGRGAVLRASLGMVREFPLTGTGGGSFEWVFSSFRPAEIVGRYNFAHNDYLQVLVETGAIGFLILLAVVGALVFSALRPTRRSERRLSVWPLGIALAAVLLHEAFDFGLQIPAIAFLVALIAGALVPRSSGNMGQAGHVLLCSFGVLLFAPAVLQSVGYWPHGSDLVPWPELDSRHHAKASAHFHDWQEDRENLSLLWSAIEEESLAQAIRPLSPYGAVAHASYLTNMLRRVDHADASNADRLLDGIVRSEKRARELDPWNASVRGRLMGFALGRGEIDVALEDAAIAARDSPVRARSVLDRLVGSGLPVGFVAERLGSDPLVLLEILRIAREENDVPTLRKLVSKNPEPSSEYCQVGWRIAQVLRFAHHESAEPFLSGCLTRAEARDEPARVDAVKKWIAQDRTYRGDYLGARQILDGVSASSGKSQLLLDLAYRREDWAGVVRAARSICDRKDDSLAKETEVRVRMQMAEAYARIGKRAQAVRQYERVLAINPVHVAAGNYKRQLERGAMPFGVGQ